MGLRGHVTQLIFLATLIKFLLRKKIFFAMQKHFFCKVFFFSAPISNFFVSFIILICNPISYLLLKLFCFNFSFLVFISFIFATQFFCFECCFLFLFKALNVILLLIFFIFLVSYILILFFHFNMYISFICCSAHVFPFHIFLCFCFFIANQLFSTSLMRFCYLLLFASFLLATFF